MADYSDVEKRAKDLLDEENKRIKQEKYEKELPIILNELATFGKNLREVQITLQHLISEFRGEEVELPYEVTPENIENPESLGNLDTLEEMVKYYKESYETSLDLSKSARRHRERKYNGIICKHYMKAYDLTSRTSSKVNAFYKKFQEILDIIDRAEEATSTDGDTGVVEEAPVDPIVPPEEKKEDVVPPVNPVEEEEEKEEKVEEVTPPPVKKSRKPREDVPGLLDDIDPKYYPTIFNVIKNTIVIGNKFKFNTLDYMEYQFQTLDVAGLQKLGFPVEDLEKINVIKEICLKLIQESKKIRKDQWLTASNEKKEGEFEGRKHSTQEAIIDRNNRIIYNLNIDPDIAAEYGIVTSLDELQKQNAIKEEEKELVTSVKEDKVFADFYDKFKTIYKLGSPTSESDDVLYKVYEDLQKDHNSFNLKGKSLEAARVLVEKTIYARRNSWQKGTEKSKTAINEIQKELGL